MKEHDIYSLAAFVLAALLKEESLKQDHFQVLAPHVESGDLLCEAHSFLGNLEQALGVCEAMGCLTQPTALERLLNLLLQSKKFAQAIKMLDFHCQSQLHEQVGSTFQQHLEGKADTSTKVVRVNSFRLVIKALCNSDK